MNLHRPEKTFADYLVIAVSPALIMVLVWSLTFFLVEVFYRGAASGSVRWVLFWFVLAVVLVTRLGIEQSSERAAIYGLALAAVTWLYLARIHPAYFVGIFLLALVWWSVHKLTRDCTLIDDDEDASGHGLLQIAWRRRGAAKETKPAADSGSRAATTASPRAERGGTSRSATPSARPGPKRRPSPAQPHPPGLWLVYFSLAALPLFGLGQTLLPGDDENARRWGFAFTFTYLAAALGLLLTTSFLGMRRYLRQRQLVMPGALAFGWIRFGAGAAMFVLVAALLLPRPDGSYAWVALRYQLDHRLRQASEFAARFSPPGKGPGRPGNVAKPGGQSGSGPARDPQAPKDPSANQGPQTSALNANQISPSPAPPAQSAPQNPPAPSPVQSPADLAGKLHVLLKSVFLVLAAALLVWWLIRYWSLLGQMIQSLIAAVKRFFQDLFASRPAFKKKPEAARTTEAKASLFAAFENPFVAARDRVWPPEQVVIYSYEALQAWARERGLASEPQQTAREFCRIFGEKFPEVGAEVDRLAFLYGHAAYGTRVPPHCDLEPLRQLWRYLSEAASYGRAAG